MNAGITYKVGVAKLFMHVAQSGGILLIHHSKFSDADLATYSESTHWGKNGKFSLKIKLKLEWANFWSVLPLLHLMMYPKLNLEKS